MNSRFALLTVDVEAFKGRSASDHVNKLVWGRHPQGTCGVREICAIGDEFNVKHVLFVDLCCVEQSRLEMEEVVSWLCSSGQDVQLHLHPEVLTDKFWAGIGLSSSPTYLNEYCEAGKAERVIGYFCEALSKSAKKKITAFRAGSFRWNADIIRSLSSVDIKLSFNNSMRAFKAGRCSYSEATNYPFLWSNGVIEIPVTEKLIPPLPGGREFWATLTFPESPYYSFQPERCSVLSRIFTRTPSFTVFLLHSWSMLYWDENGYAIYRDDYRLESYRRLLSRLTKDYDVITTVEFLDLYSSGKIPITKTVDLRLADLNR